MTPLITLVKQMRQAQKDFEKAPELTNERMAYDVRRRRLESQVDNWIEDYEEPYRQEKIF